MGLFRKSEGEERYHNGVSESFKNWFWIRLAVVLYVCYLGGDLIYQWYVKGIHWGYAAGGAALILIAIGIAVYDIRQYLMLRKSMKEEALEETADETAGLDSKATENKNTTEVKNSDASDQDRKQFSSISDFANYRSDDNEDENMVTDTESGLTDKEVDGYDEV
ncbi:MAG: hypothetical protein J6P16_02010 [Eubacterium sp.]|nr:hypothetical protein [Eubacterium sp.]